MAIGSFEVVMRVDTKHVLNMLDPNRPNGFIMVHTRNLKMGMKRITQLYARIYRKHIAAAGIKPWHGTANAMLLKQEISPSTTAGVRGTAGMTTARDYVVKVPDYMIDLDRFKKQPHWVKLLPGRSITKWVEEHGGNVEPVGGAHRRSKVTGRFMKRFYRNVKIKRHPWIDSAHDEARQYILGILGDVVRRTESEVKTNA